MGISEHKGDKYEKLDYTNSAVIDRNLLDQSLRMTKMKKNFC